MGILAASRETIRVLGEAIRLAPNLGYKMAEDDDKTSLGAVFEATVDRTPNNVMLLFEDRQWTYAEFNREVNKLAHLLVKSGVLRGDNVALLMENRPEFIIALLALVKLGVSVSLINTSLSGAALEHCINSTGASRCIVGEECASALAGVLPELKLQANRDYFWFPDKREQNKPDWAEDAMAAMVGMSDQNSPVTREITAGELALYVFTSGTTGLPKAAIVPHRKILAAGLGMGKIGFQTKPEDRLYLCLPLYHITGLGPGLCGFIACGGSIYLRRSFSASKFWPEVKQSQSNCFIYVGELCRYLTLQPECPEEKNNPLQKMMGNGLRPDVWDQFKARFCVPRICEVYGSSEGNVSFVNLLNKDKTIGAAISKMTLVQYDNEKGEILRDSAGCCIEVAIGEPGLLLAEISAKAKFDGYSNAGANADKVVQQVRKPGDQWFNTGDLIRQIDVGFAFGLRHFQFVDRTGDTFRWRAENVSTNEVAEVLNTHSQVSMANVYGVEVPGAEGRAGMVAFELSAGDVLDVDSMQALVESSLPAYAQPVFIRVLCSAQTTVTFKLLKGNLREQAFHLDKVQGDTIYVRKPHGDCYEQLDQAFYDRLLGGEAGY